MQSRGGIMPGIPKTNATTMLLIVNIAVFVLVGLILRDVRIVYAFGFIPDRLFHGAADGGGVPPVLTIFTSMFLHVEPLHIALNMFVLWMFGGTVESRMGSVRYLIFYLLCGVVGALAQAYSAPYSQAPMIGASGAIFGVLGAFALLFPDARVFLIFFPVPVRAIYMFPILIVIEVIRGLTTQGTEAGIAFWAHVGGFIAGVVLHRLFVIR